MKKIYIAPEMIIRKVFTEGIMQPQVSLGNDPQPGGPTWDDMESRDNYDLGDDHNDIWED
jgi:hypothetical protein